jgi:hypothetical protein
VQNKETLFFFLFSNEKSSGEWKSHLVSSRASNWFRIAVFINSKKTVPEKVRHAGTTSAVMLHNFGSNAF